MSQAEDAVTALSRQDYPLTTCCPMLAKHTGNSLCVIKPVSDRRDYEYLTVGGNTETRGARFILVSDPEAVFAAACLNVQAGYFDDPPDVPGFAHWLEHAVHLGSGRYPDEKDYKYYLSQHGGTSNADTSMVHTSYHFTVDSPHLGGALDRLARFFIDPLLQREKILKEAENVHAEFSRNCNSDARKLLQLRRSVAGGLLGKFSTGNATTLRERPAAAGLDVPAALAAFWRQRYLAGALCGCIVGPQPLPELRALVSEAFSGVRLSEREAGGGVPDEATGSLAEQQQQQQQRQRQRQREDTDAAQRVEEEEAGSAERAPRAARREGQGVELMAAEVPAVAHMTGNNGGGARGRGGGGGGTEVASAVFAAGGPPRYAFDDMCPADRLSRLFRVASQRELRQLEVVWYLPYGMMDDIRSKPWRWASHVLGHEGRGSLAALLRGAGLVQQLTTWVFDEVRLARGFMSWGVIITLSEAGLQRAKEVLRLVFAAVKAMRSLDAEQRRAIWEEVAAAVAVGWHYQDRTLPLDLARNVAKQLHYLEPESVLSGSTLLYEYDAAALERFLSYITPENCNVYLSDSSFAGSTDQVEPWYGAKYSEEPLNLELYDSQSEVNDDDASVTTAAASSVETHPGNPEDPYPLLLSRLRLPQPPSWALPVDVRLVLESASEAVDVPAAAAGTAGLTPGEDDGAVATLGSGGWRQGPVAPVVAETSSDGAATDAADAIDAAITGAIDTTTSDARCLLKPNKPPLSLPSRPVSLLQAAAMTTPRQRLATWSGRCVPRLLEDSGPVRLWHRMDVTFGVPKTHVYAHLITRGVYDTPASWVTARLACRLLKELLQVEVYDAQLLDTDYSLAASETGLHLSFHGFSGVVAQLAKVVAAGVAEVTWQQVQARYGLIHGKLLQALRLWHHNNPVAHAEYGAAHVLQLPHWHVDEGIDVLEKVAPMAAAAADVTVAAREDVEGGMEGGREQHCGGVGTAWRPAECTAGPVAVWNFLRGLGRGMAMEVLVYGNATEQQARDLCATLRRHLRPTGLGPDGWPATRILELAPLELTLPTPHRQQPQQLQEWTHPGREREQCEPVATSCAAAGSATEEEAEKTAMDFGEDAGPEVQQENKRVVTGCSGGGVAVPRPMLLRYVPRNPNPSNTNSAIFFLCQVGEDDPWDPRRAVLLDLLSKVASKPAFHELRTRQRLGYAVSLTKHRLGGGMGLAVRVQSPNHRPGLLRQQVAKWLGEFGHELRELSPEQLASFKSSLEEKYLEPPRSLAEAAEKIWRPIRYRSYAFQKADQKVKALRELGLQDLVRFYEQYSCPSAPSARVLCSEVWAGPAARTERSVEGARQDPGFGEGRAAGEDEGQSEWLRVGSEELEALHRQLPLFCHSETLGVLRPLAVTHVSLVAKGSGFTCVYECP